MEKLDEKKQKAMNENNSIVYNSIIIYEKLGTVIPLLDIIEDQHKKIMELESELVVLKSANNSI